MSDAGAPTAPKTPEDRPAPVDPADHPDPIDAYVAELRDILHGPPRMTARLIEEVRGGLADTAEAYTHEGTPYEDAVREAVRDFGTPAELAPACQRELTIAQARHTARSVVLVAPLLLACWYTLVTTGTGQDGLLPRTAQLLAAVAGAAAVLAATALAATGALAPRLPTPHRLPLLVAWTGTTASASMALAALSLAVASFMTAQWPLIALACTLAAVSHALTAPSARACRRCARLPA
ncbi:permease prefix domain 1-containing protein [Streptomyces sp. Je 1-79]|uniref:permease prefix domain 1-containing protein n=1 Tax=Streptomyces sp. Je 1-79 TaxID=2943847 RepID=UPI0021A8992B|nr:permease prefix domain 1-containing protein [Streptomyces sp. Je 1-79]MCT4352011.1 permease prefix domain 1-containing protein [Streptomyces sp. Je 1-79]